MTLTVTQLETLSNNGFQPFPSPTRCFLDDGTFSTVISVQSALDGDKRFAIKIIDKIILLKRNQSAAILNEKRIHSNLSHPNVVKLFKTFQDEHSLYFVLEYCDGGNLLRSKGRIPSAKIRVIVKQLVSGLRYLHAQGIIHGDIKPENILIESQIESEVVAKIADFGSALNKSECQTENLSRFVGTPEYLAPEILKGHVQMETMGALDWWALACTVYWMLTGGKVLFEAATEYLVYKAIEMGPKASALKECCDLDEVVGEIIFGLLERDPEKRLEFAKQSLSHLLDQIN